MGIIWAAASCSSWRAPPLWTVHCGLNCGLKQTLSPLSGVDLSVLSLQQEKKLRQELTVIILTGSSVLCKQNPTLMHWPSDLENRKAIHSLFQNTCLCSTEVSWFISLSTISPEIPHQPFPCFWMLRMYPLKGRGFFCHQCLNTDREGDRKLKVSWGTLTWTPMFLFQFVSIKGNTTRHLLISVRFPWLTVTFINQTPESCSRQSWSHTCPAISLPQVANKGCSLNTYTRPQDLAPKLVNFHSPTPYSLKVD